nr:phosphorylase b kinase regulatory subunit beta-like [Biomphalaria glabrata]
MVHTEHAVSNYIKLVHTEHAVSNYIKLVHTEHAVSNYIKLVHTEHAVSNYIKLVHTEHAVSNYIKLVHTEHAVSNYIKLVHTEHAVSNYIKLVHTEHAVSNYIKLVHTEHAVSNYIKLVHTEHAVSNYIKLVHTEHASPINGLFPSIGSDKNTNRIAHVQDFIYCAVAVWSLAQVYKKIDDDQGRIISWAKLMMGGDFIVYHGVVYFSNFTDQVCTVTDPSAVSKPVTDISKKIAILMVSVTSGELCIE